MRSWIRILHPHSLLPYNFLLPPTFPLLLGHQPCQIPVAAPRPLALHHPSRRLLGSVRIRVVLGLLLIVEKGIHWLPGWGTGVIKDHGVMSLGFLVMFVFLLGIEGFFRGY